VEATSTIPIVFLSADPLTGTDDGIPEVVTMARPATEIRVNTGSGCCDG
jgi:hypothetical protein